MNLTLTPEMLEAGYVLLKTTKPFRSWSLPDPDEIVFHVTRHRTVGADCWAGRKSPAEIRVSEHYTGSLARLLEIEAHEMVHLYQMLRGTETPGALHNAEFMKLIRQVAKHHAMDAKFLAW